MFSGFLTWAEAVSGRLRDGTRQRSMAGPGGTFVKFLLLIGELYFLWRHQQDKGEKYRVCQLLLPCGPKGLINLAKIIVHIIVILPSRFSLKLEALCSARCYHFLLQPVSASEAISPSTVAAPRLGCRHRNPTWPCLLPGCSPDWVWASGRLPNTRSTEAKS